MGSQRIEQCIDLIEASPVIGDGGLRLMGDLCEAERPSRIVGMTEHTDPAESAEKPPDETVEESTEISASEDIGQNAHQVVTALLGHQQDLVAELRSVYERLEQVREVDYARLQSRVEDAEHVVSGGEDFAAQVERLTERVDELFAVVAEQAQHQVRTGEELGQGQERSSMQLAERDARISAQNARIAELETTVTAAADSAETAHQKLQVLAKETESSLIHRVSERVSPAARQARTALNSIARRLRR